MSAYGDLGKDFLRPTADILSIPRVDVFRWVESVEITMGKRFRGSIRCQASCFSLLRLLNVTEKLASRHRYRGSDVSSPGKAVVLMNEVDAFQLRRLCFGHRGE